MAVCAPQHVLKSTIFTFQVYIPPIDKDDLLKEMRGFLTPDVPSGGFATTMPTIAKVMVTCSPYHDRGV